MFSRNLFGCWTNFDTLYYNSSNTSVFKVHKMWQFPSVAADATIWMGRNGQRNCTFKLLQANDCGRWHNEWLSICCTGLLCSSPLTGLIIIIKFGPGLLYDFATIWRKYSVNHECNVRLRFIVVTISVSKWLIVYLLIVMATDISLSLQPWYGF